ncbi:MAG: DUF2007 domain-containing protein, partial [Ignavibacteria bacterium]|nr:DUF2007 domain-containing protein [Ignavibacteria bacterium]
TQEVASCPHCGILLGWGPKEEEDLVCATHGEVRAMGCCVICGTPLCGDCARKRQGKIFCQGDYDLKVAFDWVAVYSAGTRYEAEMVKANLESARIPAMILSQSDRMYYTTVGDLAVTEVMVPKKDLAEAKRFLRAVETARDEQDGSSDTDDESIY